MEGFYFAGIKAGIKKKDLMDLGLIYCDTPAAAAALFTRNRIIAAPVVLGKEKIKNGRIQAILVNSGNANCFTGERGYQDAVACSNLSAEHLDIDPDHVIVSSTGVIGQPLPMEKFETGIPKVVRKLDAQGIEDFASAILTTDTCTKIVKKTAQIEGNTVQVTGIAKGSGMIRPDMATMLAFICTDAQIESPLLHQLLTTAAQKSFNRITVDGDTSTNDSVFVLASGRSKVQIKNNAAVELFQQLLSDTCLDLAKKIARDGEGATKLVKIKVENAKTKSDAFLAAEAIAHSNLVKTAIYGEDPNWGRITAAAGRSGAMVEAGKMDLYFDNEALVLKGRWLGTEAEKIAAVIMKNEKITITLDLNLGKESDFFYFCDFSEDYVKINADYRT